MSKKRRTKKEKIIAELRRELQSRKPQHTITLSHTYPTTQKEPPPQVQATSSVIPQKNYSYVLGDIKKTAEIIIILFIANLILFFLLQRNIVNLKLLGL